MMKHEIRLILLILTMLALLGASQALAENLDGTYAAGQWNPPFSGKERAALAALEARIDAGEAVNGAENVRFARTGTISKAASTFSLAPTPSQLCTQAAYSGNGYTNPLSYLHPVLISSADATLTVANVASNSSHLQVVPPASVGQPYFIRGVSKGTATLTVTASNGKVVKKTITVKVKVYISSFTFYMTDDLQVAPVAAKSRDYTFNANAPGRFLILFAMANPSSASYGGGTAVTTPQAARFISSNSAVVSLPERARGGYVVALVSKPGAATITVRATDGGTGKGSFKVNAKGAPVTDLTQIADFSMQPGMTRALSVTASPSSAWDKTIAWSTSNKNVARVDGSGNVTAVAPGAATITYKNPASGLSRKVNVTVTYSKVVNGTTYRFYTFNLVGVAGITQPQHASMALMDATFDAAYGTSYSTRYSASGGFSDVKSKLNDISTQFMDQDDVTVVYLAGNALSSTGSDTNGALYGTTPNGFLEVMDVQLALQKVKGTVVLIVDADCSGAFNTSKGTASKATVLAQQKAFVDAWTGAFASGGAADIQAKGLADSANNSKFKLLVSSSSSGITQQNSDGKYLLFTYWLARGLGATFGSDGYANTYTAFTPAAAPANAGKKKDKVVTLAELFSYVRARAKTEFTPVKWQTISVWPANDRTAILNQTE